MLHGMWDLPGLESELVSPALTGGFLATVPPGKSLLFFFIVKFYSLHLVSYLVFGSLSPDLFNSLLFS